MLMPALYRTHVTHLRRRPVHNEFGHRSYAWYFDIDAPPRLPILLRPFAVFRAEDHLSAPATGADTLRTRVDTVLAGHDIDLSGGRVTALLHARVLGYSSNPISIFWCHDSDGTLAHVIVEVHNTRGQRHAYVLPPTEAGPVAVCKDFFASPFNEVDGYYLVYVPKPDLTAEVAVTWHRDNELVFSATLHGERRAATTRQVATMQVRAPLAPLVATFQTRLHAISLWRRGLTVVGHGDGPDSGRRAGAPRGILIPPALQRLRTRRQEVRR
ncbi:DUF1365 domain-containing protein [Mycobacterium sp. NPDC003323]